MAGLSMDGNDQQLGRSKARPLQTANGDD